ncbi:kinase-like protein, partial [Exidia glandulosa HHB12029]
LLRTCSSPLNPVHGIAVVHGDIKGANILVSDDGHACLSDFGVSAVLSEHPSHTASGTGTYRWMAPDLFGEHSVLTRQTDIWAVGCVILEVRSDNSCRQCDND